MLISVPYIFFNIIPPIALVTILLHVQMHMCYCN